MSKAKLIFLVLALGYITIGFLTLFGVVNVSGIVLLGLSLSAFFASLSDVLNQCILYSCQKNHMSYIAKCSVQFINNRLDIGAQQFSNMISIRNVKKNIEDQNPRFDKSVHPSVFSEKRHIKIINMFSYASYVFSIISFIVSPFTKIDFTILESFSVFVALCAFGVMCFNLFLSELNSDLSKKMLDYFNNTQPIINSVYPDFIGTINSQLNYREDLKASKVKFDKETTEVHAETDAFIDKTVEDYNNGNN